MTDFILGTHMVNWLARTEVPMMVSHRRLAHRKSFPRANNEWVLDSGGFTELHKYGGWETTPSEYAEAVSRYADEIGNLRWVSPQDWMCEPTARKQTGLTVSEHQKRTISNFLELRQRLGHLVVPVLQGWEHDDYLSHVEQYERAGVDLTQERVVGLGSVCRRNADADIGRIVRSLWPLRLHAYGVKGTAWAELHNVLVSADSMAWSAAGRRNKLSTCVHRAKSCANCWVYAMRWHEKMVKRTQQQRLWASEL